MSEKGKDAPAPILQARGIVAGYGKIEVLHGLDIELHCGEIVTILGANGAGKTTLLRCLSRIHDVSAGEIKLRGESLVKRSADELPGLGLAHVPEGRLIFPRLTVLENLELGAYCLKRRVITTASLSRVFDLFPVLAERANQQGGTLSGGEQQMLAIARALMSEPSVLLLDEPSMGVAPLLVEKIFKTIKALNADGLSILIVEQNAHLALEIADRGYVLETGKILFTDSASALSSDPRVREAYLGE